MRIGKVSKKLSTPLKNPRQSNSSECTLQQDDETTQNSVQACRSRGWHPQLLADQLTLFQPEENLCPRLNWPHRILRPSYGPEFIAAFFSTRRSYFILGSRQYAGSVLTLRRFEYDYGGQKAICQFCRCAGSISDQAELKTRDSYFQSCTTLESKDCRKSYSFS